MTTDYYRVVRSDFLEDMTLSPDAFRVLAYMAAQADGFRFNLPHLQRVFQGKIGLKRLKNARRELIAGGWLTPGPKHRDTAGQIAQAGATVNWSKVCLPSSHRRSPYRPSGNRPSGKGTDRTNYEVHAYAPSAPDSPIAEANGEPSAMEGTSSPSQSSVSGSPHRVNGSSNRVDSSPCGFRCSCSGCTGKSGQAHYCAKGFAHDG